ncbi:hypothetical protein MHM84_10235 [Halomonas sp. McH1-25]|uniref:COG4648 family protein n=1 Tax=unclassified Halomonas TaxID=2609666 RepID=UPI001EF68EFA|nr:MULTISPECIES: hypothetical protein [unclassified Halomonas]MCG7600168.1 hypothetical protein [Halomonas sp. McH1-25]MCP1341417.1 hypothetical protein [Halomonas sp. FL8]MCP1359638.1 hypothetical protein [Halomonas sp. BBD45]MCP1365706.1 hypothetical protein [Halomonas sp. BBD48]
MPSLRRVPSLPRGPVLLGLLGLAWPLLALLLVPSLGPWPLLVAAVALACWRLPKGHRHWGILLTLAALLAALFGHAELGVRAWPVIVNAALLAVFAGSLRQEQSMIERLARRQEPDLPPRGVTYTRRVTQLWCVFFLCNGAMALWTALYADLAFWTLYNGGIAYGLCALLFAGEWCVRQRVRKRS